MKLEIQCSKCNEQYSCPERHAGKAISCPNCGSPIQVPKIAEKLESPSKAETESKAAPAVEAWFIRTSEGQQIGPVTKSKLDQMVSSKDFSGCLLRKDGSSEWKLFSDIYPAAGTPEPSESQPSESQPSESQRVEVWFIRTSEGQEIGPVTKPKLDRMVSSKDFSGCLLRRDGSSEWKPFSEVYPAYTVPEAPQVPASPTPVDPIKTPDEATVEGPSPAESSATPAKAAATTPPSEERKPIATPAKEADADVDTDASQQAGKRKKTIIMAGAGCGALLVVMVLCWGVLGMLKGPSNDKTDVSGLSVEDGTCRFTQEVRLPQSANGLCRDVMEAIYAVAKNRPDVKRIEFTFLLVGGVDEAGNRLEQAVPMGELSINIEDLEGAREYQDLETYLKSEHFEFYEIEIKGLSYGHMLT